MARRPVVTKYWREFQASGLTFEQLETMPVRC